MVGKITIRVEGTKQIEAALKELGVRAANRIARSALNRSATVVVKRAKELVPPAASGTDRARTIEVQAETRRLVDLAIAQAAGPETRMN